MKTLKKYDGSRWFMKSISMRNVSALLRTQLMGLQLKLQHYAKQTACLATLLSIATTGCTTQSPVNQNPKDPYENGNRKIYAFNVAIDKAIVKPIAKGYDFVMPNIAQKGVLNAYNNIGEIPNIANDILQIDAPWTLVDTWRFILNTTIGIAGLFDVATSLGLPKHTQDFGLTLAKWGAKDTPYIMLPLLGPSTLRDTVGVPFNFALNPATYITPWQAYAAVKSVNVVSARANLLSADKVIEESFDPYIFVRNAYLQKRASLINKIKKTSMENNAENSIENNADSTNGTVDKANSDNSSNSTDNTKTDNNNNPNS